MQKITAAVKQSANTVQKAGFQIATPDGIATPEPKVNAFSLLGRVIGTYRTLERHEIVGQLVREGKNLYLYVYGVENYAPMQALAKTVGERVHRPVSVAMADACAHVERFTWEAEDEVENISFQCV